MAVDPSPGFVEGAQARNPDADVRLAAAEELPFDDDSFDAALAQLVVDFMAGPMAGLREWGAWPGAASSRHASGTTPEGPGRSRILGAAHELDPDMRDESGLAGAGRATWSGCSGRPA